MGSLPPELSLDIRPTFVPKTISALLKELSAIRNFSVRATKLDDFVKRLEEEMRKIDAFKRELPLCMLLLSDAILALKDELLQLTAPKVQQEPEPVLEEFIPMKESESEGCKKENERRDKKHWMSTFQLYDYQSIDPPKQKEIKRKEEDCSTKAEVGGFQIQSYKKSNGGGRAFSPYSDFPDSMLRKEEKEELPLPGLSLFTPGTKNPREDSGSSGSKTSYSSRDANVPSSLGTGPSQSQCARKQRRCWSPELHRRFINALQQLGGSQVATPKQIRDLMQVDGLTNDEVKSHLQKYRLHTRRATGTAPSTPANQSTVVLGGLWMPQDRCSESSKTNSSQSGSPQGPFQLGTHDSTTGGDSMGDDEDEEEKSESYSYKNHIHKPIKCDV